MRLSKEQIQVIKDILSRKPVLRAFVFGSFARDEADNDSDIDLLVELDYTQHIGLGFVAIQQELEDMLHHKVDLVSAGGLSNRLRPYIDQEKQMIYEKASG
ncbi:MAG: nucleotidyltransferase domain-containing protein [Chitinophagales bacterium]|nr:nucleotidyltransferase domain-containing protein [Chitinophagales bacterium]